MDRDALALFIEVMRAGSFAAVARNRAIDPSLISRTISKLERELGFRLFQRSTRRNTPTEAGQLYFEKIEPLLEELHLAQDSIKNLTAAPKGNLRVTTSIAFGQMCILPYLKEFRRLYPDIGLHLIQSDANLDLIAERIDIAIRLAPRLDLGYIGMQLFPTRYHVCVSPAYGKKLRALSQPQDLSEIPCLLLDLPSYRERWLFQPRRGPIFEVPVQGNWIFSNPLALRSAALDGAGPALLANWMVDKDLAEGRLMDLFPAYRVAATSFETAAWLIYPSRSHLPSKVRVFIDFLKAGLAKQFQRQG